MHKKHLLRMSLLLSHRPQTDVQLHAWVKSALGLDIPRRSLLPGSVSPMTYLSHTFFEKPHDVLVWANRGGGKTMLGAVATVLDLVFKPGIQIRILGGSLEQSSRMYEYVLQLMDRPVLAGFLKDTPTQRHLVTPWKSRAAILSQSQQSVRGVRVHKLRCDEVDLFSPDIWDAAQLVTRSGDCGGVSVCGTVEAMSTMHRPGGLMSRLAQTSSAKLLKWTAMDVIEKCDADRECGTCVLYSDCQGRAKHASGFVRVEDLIRQWHRSSRAMWSAEMMCDQPMVRDGVYEEFVVEGRHVRGDVNLKGDVVMVGGMDFGYRNPTVMLWACVEGVGIDAIVYVIDEYSGEQMTLEDHLKVIGNREHGKLAWIGIDPAGSARNSQTGMSDAQLLRQKGYIVRSTGSRVRDGIERIRRRLDHDRLLIHPRCVELIEAMRAYHFDHDRPQQEEPVKDGPDHWCDALRYLVVNLESSVEEGMDRRGY